MEGHSIAWRNPPQFMKQTAHEGRLASINMAQDNKVELASPLQLLLLVSASLIAQGFQVWVHDIFCRRLPGGIRQNFSWSQR